MNGLPNWLPFPKEHSTTALSIEDGDKTAGLGGEIRRIRTNRGLTQQQLADKIGLTRTSVTNMEAGRQAINLVMLEKIADALDCNVFIQLHER